MDKSRKDLVLDMSNKYENALKLLEEIKYFLRLQGRYKEVDLLIVATEQVKLAAKVWDEED